MVFGEGTVIALVALAFRLVCRIRMNCVAHGAAVGLMALQTKAWLVFRPVDDVGHGHALDAAHRTESSDSDVMIRIGFAAVVDFHQDASRVFQIEHRVAKHFPVGVAGMWVIRVLDAQGPTLHEDHDVGLGDRLPGLLGHLHVDAAFGGRLEAAGVDHDVFVPALLALAVVAVPRQAREVGDDGVACLRQAIEHRRLANVGSANKCNNGLHGRTVSPAPGRPKQDCAPSGGSEYTK